MTEVDQGIFKTFIRLVYRSSLARAIIYTIGHIFIAMTCNHLITGAPLDLAAADALIEPMINGVWFFALDKFWASKIINKVTHEA
tara:strand:+ start:646 stop:900 length:255 start_codon:yes stop_codon:yes gene_type:complete